MEDYVTYEQAVLLKELGFDWKCYTFYHWDDWCGLSHSGVSENHNMFEKCISAPTLAQAQKWLMNEKGIAIGIIPSYDIQDDGTYHWKYWYKIYSSVGKLLYTEMAEVYEHALECAISDALDLLKFN